MKFAVLSDTHIPVAAPGLPRELFELISGMDAIIHAGDFQCMDLVRKLSSCKDKEFYGVCGNMDPPEIAKLLPKKRIIRIGGFSIGIVHGWGSPEGLTERVCEVFKGDDVQVVVFGHSHRAVNDQRGDLLLFNPGSPTDTRFTRQNSVGVLSIEKGIISAEIIAI